MIADSLVPALPKGWQGAVREAANIYGTPLFVYFADVMAAQLARLRKVLPDEVELFYSVKANPNPSILRFFVKHGTHLELASGGEMVIARRMGCPTDRMIIAGPAKTDAELSAAASAGLRAVIVESSGELARLASVANDAVPVPVMLRLNLGRSNGGLTMGGDTQFGMPVDTAVALIRDAESMPSVRISGLHTYAGTQRFSPQDIITTSQTLLDAATFIQEETRVRLPFLDFGGGFGSPVRKGDTNVDWSDITAPLRRAIADYRRLHPWTTTMAFESGRFLVGPSGVLVTSVQDVKTCGMSHYVLMDGGIGQFGFDDRYFGQRAPSLMVLTAPDAPTVTAHLCGPLCTPADRIAANVSVPHPQRGDHVCIFNAGAYGLTGNPGLFLSRGFAAEVLVEEGAIRLIRRRFGADEYSALTDPFP